MNPKAWHTDWALGHGGGVARTLLRRTYQEGDEGVWQEVARFDNYNDAESALRLIRLGQRVGEGQI